MKLILRTASDRIFHISESEAPSSMLTRYAVIGKDIEERPLGDSTPLSLTDDTLTFDAKRKVTVELEHHGREYSIHIPLAKEERLFGGGDSNRECVMIRGSKLVMHIANVRSYGPMPVVLSSDGWALVLNTTYASVFDLGKTHPDRITIRVLGGEIDFYLFRADSLAALLGEVTKVTGRPILMPKFAYGLTFVMNTRCNYRDLFETALRFREREIPLDTIGLEPGWMAQDYDFTNNKKWDTKKFPLISWKPENQSDHGTIFYPLRRMGIQLSLWLCEDYDFLYHEESLTPEEEKYEFPEDAEILDPHLSASIWSDRITNRGERWFEHLKKFVDNGAAAFKLDGSRQVLNHPDRLWAGKYLDEEVHNIYPVLLAREMQSGFFEHTGRRPLIYTAGAYIGTQQFAATWAGDTGGDARTLVSVMNYAMCGHSNTGCDISIHDAESTHYGFLMPWSQQNNWDYYMEPWYLGDEISSRYTYYARLRSSLFPYLYTAAHQAYETGIPMLRPLPLVYEGTDRFDKTMNAYMLGDSLFVGAFDMHIPLPEGRWVDYITGEVYEGGVDIDYQPPKGLGGALFVRSGDVIVTMKPQRYILEHAHEYRIDLFPDDRASAYELYEDDGFTEDYKNGGYATTRIESSGVKNGAVTLTVYPREGGFGGRPENGHNIMKNSIPKISPMGEVNDMTAVIHTKKTVTSVTLGGKGVDFTTCPEGITFTVDAALHADKAVAYEITFED